MTTPGEEPVLRSPSSPADWDAYFDLRWRILRAPWDQPRGSERDSEDKSAFHLLLIDPAGTALACGRFHQLSPGEAQIRYMAVAENARGCGYGRRILDGLEAEAWVQGVRKIVLNSREDVTEFCRKRGYQVIGEPKRYLA